MFPWHSRKYLEQTSRSVKKPCIDPQFAVELLHCKCVVALLLAAKAMLCSGASCQNLSVYPIYAQLIVGPESNCMT